GAAAGVAAAGLALGTVYGLRAASRSSDADERCDESTVCSRDGFVAQTEALDHAEGSTLSFVVAGVATAGAVALWLGTPDGGEAGAPGGGAVSLVPLFGERIGLTLTVRGHGL
ncbi:MAG: hypothetical protein AAGC55_29120, partial [Myxococcota bacterium]